MNSARTFDTQLHVKFIMCSLERLLVNIHKTLETVVLFHLNTLGRSSVGCRVSHCKTNKTSSGPVNKKPFELHNTKACQNVRPLEFFFVVIVRPQLNKVVILQFLPLDALTGQI